MFSDGSTNDSRVESSNVNSDQWGKGFGPSVRFHHVPKKGFFPLCVQIICIFSVRGAAIIIKTNPSFTWKTNNYRSFGYYQMAFSPFLLLYSAHQLPAALNLLLPWLTFSSILVMSLLLVVFRNVSTSLVAMWREAFNEKTPSEIDLTLQYRGQ